MRMATSMKVNGKTIKPMEKECIYILMAPNISDMYLSKFIYFKWVNDK